MGNSTDKEEEKEITDWFVVVKTGDHKGAGTDSNIYIRFIDKNGNKSEIKNLDVFFRDDFERGKKDRFTCSEIPNDSMDIPCTLELWKDDAGYGSDWYCEVISLIGPNVKLDFPVLRWVIADYHYMIPLYDTTLPQYDPFPKQRQDELKQKRERYQMEVICQNLPPQLHELPAEEMFSEDVLKSFEQGLRSSILGAILGRLIPGSWSSYKDHKTLYLIESSFIEPKGHSYWKSDEYFGAQRLVGVNPMSIQLCTSIPKMFHVTDKLLEPLLEGLSLEEAMESKKVFIVNYEDTKDLKCLPGFKICAPMALFLLNNKQQLIPVAIQLHQKEDATVFTPDIDEHKWTLVKLWFNLMDATVHQFVFHLGSTHLIMESMALATHRCLAPNHPIFRLLSPHFLYLMAINKRAMVKLANPGGILDSIMSAGAQAGLQLFSNRWRSWNLSINGHLPNEIKERGVDEKVIPVYPYRDDGILVYNAIKQYVTDIVNLYYESEDQIKEDNEIQNWGRVLSTPVMSEGCGLKGVPNDGNLQVKDDIIMICTSIIFTCSAQHAAVNFGQYNNYGVPLSYPGMLTGCPPTDTDAMTEKEVLAHMPSKKILFRQLTVSKILSTFSTERLGTWEIRWQYDPKAITVEKRFQEELEKVSQTIKERNNKRGPHKNQMVRP